MNFADVIEQKDLTAGVAWIIFNLDFKPGAAATIEIEMHWQLAALLLWRALQIAECVAILIIERQYLVPNLAVGASATATEQLARNAVKEYQPAIFVGHGRP